MKVVINNWREDGEKEAVDMWDNNGLSYPCSPAHRGAHVILYGVTMIYCTAAE